MATYTRELKLRITEAMDLAIRRKAGEAKVTVQEWCRKCLGRCLKQHGKKP